MFVMGKRLWKRSGIALAVLLVAAQVFSLLPVGSALKTPLADASDLVEFGNLMGMDELERSMLRDGQVRSAQSDRYVGVFYFLWHGQHGSDSATLYDIAQIRATDPNAIHDANSPLWGSNWDFHFYGKSLFDYYLSDDAWVLRKHVQMLTDAQVDFLVFDTTNQYTYKPVYDALFAILDEVRLQGRKVPQIAFYTNTNSGTRVTSLYNDIYLPNRYPELWFHWDGKPLMIGDPTQVSSTIQNFFTFRLNEWPNSPKNNGFPWMEFRRPQRVHFNSLGEKEIISVSLAQHPHAGMSISAFYNDTLNWGRNYHNSVREMAPGALNWGLNAAEQWDFAIAEDPKIIFVTGWNEWAAPRIPTSSTTEPIWFIDLATPEYSRDAEPMSGGYGDNYYMQMMSYIRKYKGADPQPAPSAPQTIAINTDFSQWDDVTPEYRDYTADTTDRNHGGIGGVTYTNTTGRNDLDVQKVARDDDNLYFYTSTADALTAYTDAKWMRLFIDTDGDPTNGWHGYDYVVNRTGPTATTAAVERSTGGWNWTAAGTADYKTSGNELHLAIPRSVLGLDNLGLPLTVQFKWSDNMQADGDMMDFYVNGDAAPGGRLNYVYTEAPGLPAEPINVEIAAGYGQITLNWKAIPGATSYNVKRSLTAGGPYTTVSTAGTVTSAAYTDAGLSSATPYYYVVSAVNGNGESFNSRETSAVPVHYNPVKSWNFNVPGSLEGWSIGTQMTGAVKNGSLVLVSSGTDPKITSPNFLAVTNPAVNRYVRIRMKNYSGSTTGQIYFITNTDGAYGEPKSKTFPIVANSDYTDYVVDMGTNALWTGTIKQIRVDPFPSTGTVMIDSIRISNSGILAPTGLDASPSSNAVNLHWSAVSGATSYHVKRSTTPGGPYTTISAPGAVISTAYTDTGLSNGTSYYYVVTAVQAGDESPVSAEKSAVPVTYVSARDWNFNAAGNLEGWSMGNQLTNTVADGALQLTSSGTDPYFFSPSGLSLLDPALYRYVRIRMKNGTSSTVGQIYFTTQASGSWSESKSKAFTIAANSGYTDYVVDMGTNANWTGTVTRLRVDPINAAGTASMDYIRVTGASNTYSSFNSSAGFSATQLQGQWSYQYTSDLAVYTNLTWNAANSYWGSTGARVSATGQHPNTSAMAVRTWTVPIAGTVNVAGTVKKNAGSASGNGVNAKIMKNGTQVWPSSGWEFIAGSDTTGVSYNFNVTVTGGDRLYFVVDSNGDHSYDLTDEQSTITY